MASKYTPLERMLAGTVGDVLALSLAEVEAVLGFPLPPSARNHPAWWSNAHHNPAARAWRRAGWRATRVDLGRESVTFVRDRAPATPGGRDDARGGLHIPLEDLSPAARLWLQDRAHHAGTGLAEAMVEFVNAEAASRRRGLIERFARLSPRLSDDSTDLIREDRDAR